MIKQKKGFWLFITSLIPGAGEMYMGFRKKGISIMLVFWSMFALSSAMGIDFLIMFVPIIWFYSFFDVHNLKSLSEEEFYSIEDSYILNLDQLIGDTNAVMSKYRVAVAVLLILFGFSIIWNNIVDIIYWIFPGIFGEIISSIFYRLPQIIVAAAIIIVGFYILSGKKNRLHDQHKEEAGEHYWEPYRPYQQQGQDTGNRTGYNTSNKTGQNTRDNAGYHPDDPGQGTSDGLNQGMPTADTAAPQEFPSWEMNEQSVTASTAPAAAQMDHSQAADTSSQTEDAQAPASTPAPEIVLELPEDFGEAPKYPPYEDTSK